MALLPAIARNRYCSAVGFFSFANHARESGDGVGQGSRSDRFPIGLCRRLQLRTVGPAVEVFDDVGVARPARRRRLSLFGQLAGKLDVLGHA